MNSDVLTQLSGAEIARRIRDRDLSPVEVVEGYLERIDRYDGVLHSYITVCRDEALAAARRAEQAVLQGESLGPLHGLPLAVKDQLDTAGVLTTAGSTILADYVPTEDATLIGRAKAAGAVLLGKLNMTEFAAGQGDPFKHGDPARNPWDLERYPGSSSTGSGIAIAASLCAIALGEDTGGSIRGPASFCGIVGLRPTWGLLSRYRMWPISWSMDAAGPMTHTVEDTALLTGAIAGYDPRDPQTSRHSVPDYAQALASGVRGLRVGLIREFLDPDHADGEVVQAVRAAASLLGEMGAMVEDVGFPLGADTGTLTDAIAINDGGYFHREWLDQRPQDYGTKPPPTPPLGGAPPGAPQAEGDAHARAASPGMAGPVPALRPSPQPHGAGTRSSPLLRRARRDQGRCVQSLHRASGDHGYRRPLRHAGHVGPVRVHGRGASHRSADHGGPVPGGPCVPHGPRVRAEHRLAHAAADAGGGWVGGQRRQGAASPLPALAGMAESPPSPLPSPRGDLCVTGGWWFEGWRWG